MIILYVLLSLSCLFVGFANFSPEIGSNPTKKEQNTYNTYQNYKDGEFINIEDTRRTTGQFSIVDFFKNDSNRLPKDLLEDKKIDLKKFKSKNQISFSWLGHSSFLFNINEKLIMLDPILSDYASPIPIKRFKRFNTNTALSIDELDSIDIVIFSHDHYDHLDYKTVKYLHNKVRKFVVPVGLGNHLRGWGVSSNSIIELNWEESFVVDELEFVCLPSRHYSGRSLFNTNSTLWASWAILSKKGKIYFSGDSGYGLHFKEIGNNYGPFDVSLIDCGQYNNAWKHLHMFPEECTMASIDLKSNYYMPIHWGAFTLSIHDWNEPIKQSVYYSEMYGQKILAPRIGEVVVLDSINHQIIEWWNE